MRWVGGILPLLLLAVATSSAAASLALRVASQEVAVGADFTLTVTAEDADSLGALLIVVEYGADHLRAIGPPAVHGDSARRRLRPSPLAGYPDSSGALTVAWLSSLAVDGTDTLIVLSFRDMGPPGSQDSVRLVVLDAVDIAGRPVVAETEPGIVTVSTTLRAETIPSSRPLSLSVAPNPGGPTMVVELVLPAPAPARIDIVDVAGRRVATLWNGPADAGSLRLPVGGPWTRTTPPGLYFARAQVGAFRLVRRFVFIR